MLSKKKTALFKRPVFDEHEKFVDSVLQDPESFTAIHAVIDALIMDRDRSSNRFVGLTQVYASQLKMLYIYENVLKSMLKLDDKQFSYLKKQADNVIYKTIKNVDFERIGKKIAEERAKRMSTPEEFVQELGNAMEREKAKNQDYIK